MLNSPTSSTTSDTQSHLADAFERASVEDELLTGLLYSGCTAAISDDTASCARVVQKIVHALLESESLAKELNGFFALGYICENQTHQQMIQDFLTDIGMATLREVTNFTQLLLFLAQPLFACCFKIGDGTSRPDLVTNIQAVFRIAEVHLKNNNGEFQYELEKELYKRLQELWFKPSDKAWAMTPGHQVEYGDWQDDIRPTYLFSLSAEDAME